MGYPLRLATLLLAAAATNQADRIDAWRVIGPGGGGAQFHPTISPHDANLVLVSCDMTGAYITRDGGSSWRMFNLRGPVKFFVFDPVNPKVIYAQTIGLFRSSDGGNTWAMIHPDPATVTGIGHPDDHAGDVLILSAPSESIVALAVDPADSARLYAAFVAGSRTTLRASTDGGATWSDLVQLPGGARKIYIDPNSPPADRTIYVVGTDSVFLREAGEWKQGPSAPAPFTDVSAGFPAAGGRLILWALARGIYRSDDGGDTWRNAGVALNARRFQAIATPLYSPNVAYVSYTGLPSEGESFFGVAKTTDGGQTWDAVWRESNRKSPDVDDGWVSSRFGPGWGENPLALGVAPNNPDLCYGTDYGRTLRTPDGGKTWLAAYTLQTEKGGFATAGLDVTTSYGIHWDPFDSQRLFVSYTDIGLFHSADGGASWEPRFPRGIPSSWHNTTYWVEFDPEVSGRMWAAMSGTHDLPRPKMWRNASPSNFRGGVLRSDDGGLNWTPLTNGIPQTAVTQVLLDRASPVDARVLYATGFGTGVYKSSDGGTTWTPRNNGLPPVEPLAWRMALAPDRSLYLVVARRSENGTYGNAQDGALYRSTDGASTWEKLPLPAGLNGPNGIAVDPDDPNRLYLAAWGRRSSPNAVMGGIWISTDAGRAWRPVLDRDQHIYDITIDTRAGKTLYACGFELSAWRSDDAGETWLRIRGYNFKWGHRVIPDPADPALIYITTFGGSVWHGPARGDSEAVEDIVTPQVAYSPPKPSPAQ